MIVFLQKLYLLKRFNYPVSWKNWAIRSGYILLQISDLQLTLFGISHGFMELNPLLRGLLNAPLQLVIFKAAIPVLIVVFIPAKLLLPAIVLLAAVNVWDVLHLISAGAI
jgi:hypothetical protein